MLYALPEEQAPELTIAPDIAGPCAVHVGINFMRTPYEGADRFNPYGHIWLKMAGDPGYTRFSREIFDGGFLSLPSSHAERKTVGAVTCYTSLFDIFWKVADMTGKNVQIRLPWAPFCDEAWIEPANIAYLRFEPLNGKLLAQYEQLRPRAETRKLMAFYCTGHISGHANGTAFYRPNSKEWMRNEMAQYLDSDVGTVVIETVRGDLAIHRSKIGHSGAADGTWKDEWIDPLAEAVAIAHANGLKLYAGVRAMDVVSPIVHNPITWSPFVRKNRQWAKRDCHGLPCSSLSVAFPEVRQYYLGMLAEALDLGCDGAVLYLHRCNPQVAYEQPVVESFIERYGEDPRTLPDDDPRWGAHRGDFLTRYIAEASALVRSKSGRKLGVTVHGRKVTRGVVNGPFDFERWIEERLVDHLVLHDTPTDIAKRIIELSRGRVEVIAYVGGGWRRPEDLARWTKEQYAMGYDGLGIWDSERKTPRASDWAVIRHLGHGDQLDFLASEAERAYFTRVPLRTLDHMSTHYMFRSG